MRRIEKVILHCSASAWGSAKVIEKWHLQRGFNSIGYHFVIGNGRPKSQSGYLALWDGKIEKGREEGVMGAHAKGHNRHSIGVCLIGQMAFTPNQIRSLQGLIWYLRGVYGLQAEDILGHNEVDLHGKTCPNFNVRDWV